MYDHRDELTGLCKPCHGGNDPPECQEYCGVPLTSGRGEILLKKKELLSEEGVG